MRFIYEIKKNQKGFSLSFQIYKKCDKIFIFFKERKIFARKDLLISYLYIIRKKRKYGIIIYCDKVNLFNFNNSLYAFLKGCTKFFIIYVYIQNNLLIDNHNILLFNWIFLISGILSVILITISSNFSMCYNNIKICNLCLYL